VTQQVRNEAPPQPDALVLGEDEDGTVLLTESEEDRAMPSRAAVQAAGRQEKIVDLWGGFFVFFLSFFRDVLFVGLYFLLQERRKKERKKVDLMKNCRSVFDNPTLRPLRPLLFLRFISFYPL
jgi:hypothetical protein